MRSSTAAIFATLLACALISSTHAYLSLSYGEFQYDGDYVYLPAAGGQVVSGDPDSTSTPFHIYSNFYENGATIKSIQS